MDKKGETHQNARKTATRKKSKENEKSKDWRVSHPAAKGVRQKEFGKKSDEKSDRSIRKSDQKVTERVPKTKKMIEVLLPTSFCGTLSQGN